MFCFLFLSDLAAKLRKKLVKAKRFWKINAVRPKIKAKRGKNKEVQFETNHYCPKKISWT